MRDRDANHLRRVGFVGNHPPRQCGIATFTADLSQSVANLGIETEIVAINDFRGRYEYPPEVTYQVHQNRLSEYRAAADYLNLRGVSAVSLQHEFGIFGGPAGSHVLQLMRNLRMPIVTTLHTILEEPSPEQRSVLEEVAQLSQRLVVMSEKGRQILINSSNIDPERIDLIPHGSPEVAFLCPDAFKGKLGLLGRKVILTFGLLSPDKGIEYAIRALPELVKADPTILYLVLGATHPNLKQRTNDAYRKSLQGEVVALGLEDNVRFEDRFVELDELLEYLQAADIYLTPYLKPAQVTSGTLSYAFGCGKAIISTPYWHAEELLADGKGVLVPFRDSESIANAIQKLFGDEEALDAMRNKAYAASRGSTWPNTGRAYIRCFEQAILESADQLRGIHLFSANPKEEVVTPEINLTHLKRMTDDTGMFQHATGSMPNRNEGYCIDDNARALLLCARLQSDPDFAPTTEELGRTYLSFVHHAYEPVSGRFHNFMAYERTWLDSFGSEDSHGRTLWSLGEFIRSQFPANLREVAYTLFERSVPAVTSFTSPRAWAFSILGMAVENSPLSGASTIQPIIRDLSNRLLELYKYNANPGWKWFESYLSYDNARLSQAMIVASRVTGSEEMLTAGLESLAWLCRQQTHFSGVFAPIGSDEVWHRGNSRPMYDQQPLEAWATIEACLAAEQATGNRDWLLYAQSAMEWFTGSNMRNMPVADRLTGACNDGLQSNRISENQGAESTLAYLTSALAMKPRLAGATGPSKMPEVAK